MNSTDLRDLQQLAMLAELARPLTHECNNFLNNLLLQVAISEKSFPESSRAEWANIRREGKKLASLFQQWQRHRKPPSERPTTVELHSLIQEAIEELRSESAAIQFFLQPPAEALAIMGSATEVQRLCSLLLHYAVACAHSGVVENPTIEIQIERNQNRIFLRFVDASPVDANLRWVDFDDLATSDRITLSLPALACKSLVERLQGNVCLENLPNGRVGLTLAFPAAAYR